MPRNRILFSIFLLLAAFFAPFWWLTAGLAMAGFFLFPIYWEGAVILLLWDLWYGAEIERLWHWPYWGFTFAAIALVAVEMLKKKLKFYEA